MYVPFLMALMIKCLESIISQAYAIGSFRVYVKVHNERVGIAELTEKELSKFSLKMASWLLLRGAWRKY